MMFGEEEGHALLVQPVARCKHVAEREIVQVRDVDLVAHPFVTDEVGVQRESEEHVDREYVRGVRGEGRECRLAELLPSIDDARPAQAGTGTEFMACTRVAYR
jgi:hypothetical protein